MKNLVNFQIKEVFELFRKRHLNCCILPTYGREMLLLFTWELSSVINLGKILPGFLIYSSYTVAVL